MAHQVAWECSLEQGSWKADWWWPYVLLVSCLVIPLSGSLTDFSLSWQCQGRQGKFLCHRRSSLCDGDAAKRGIPSRCTKIALEMLPIPKSLTLTRFIALYISFALLMTVTTPLMRLVTGKWWAHLSVNSALYHAGLISDPPTTDIYPDPSTPEHYNADRAFYPHAIAGLAWLVAAGFQCVFSPRNSRRCHRISGYVSAAVFAVHVSVCFWALYIDVEKHTVMNKVMLSWTNITAVMYFVRGVVAAKDGLYESHMDNIFRALAYSTEGAGSIRLVTHVQTALGLGPLPCQAAHKMVGTQCMWSYGWRMIWVRALTLFWIGVYSRITGKDGHVSLYWFTEVVDHICFMMIFGSAAMGAHALPGFAPWFGHGIAILVVWRAARWLKPRSSWFQSRLRHRRLSDFKVPEVVHGDMISNTDAGMIPNENAGSSENDGSISDSSEDMG